MRHLVAKIISLKNRSGEGGFNLIEIMAILVIIGIGSAIGTPSLINSQRQDQVNQTHSKIRSALVEAQINANRLSTTCTVTIGNSTVPPSSRRSVTASPSGCLLETITYDSSIVSVSSTNGSLPTAIAFDFRGGTGVASMQTLRIFRQDYSSPPNPIPGTGKCIVIASTVGMIRSGNMNPVNGGPNDCNNPENNRYDSSTP